MYIAAGVGHMIDMIVMPCSVCENLPFLLTIRIGGNSNVFSSLIWGGRVGMCGVISCDVHEWKCVINVYESGFPHPHWPFPLLVCDLFQKVSNEVIINIY